eukprot:CAMPEP_0181472482 /NCGR_PEP_ID=MMETSP1110-20121109/39625_1 /TAXON_ID=174948 /ORGANISM="Symbiodinium sp., Strain CCMP421" /LENGTH=83 /DNA_ID=CAMNT_0023597557 /DNA_START=65 /DNA_END=316 /DNA_ORIENTATION=-
MARHLLLLVGACLCAYLLLAPLAFLGSSAPTRSQSTRGDVAVYGRHGKRGAGGPRHKKVPADIEFEYIPYKRQGKKMDKKKAR